MKQIIPLKKDIVFKSKIGDLSNDGYINATDAAMILDCFKNGTITYVTI